jgi:hypothetical protein
MNQRRFGGRLIVGVLAVLVAIVGGCVRTGNTTSAGPTGPSSASATPTLTPPSASPAATATASKQMVAASALDPAKDASHADVRKVALAHQNDSLAVDITLAASLPITESALVVVWVASADGESSRQLGMKWVDGELAAFFVFDSSVATQENLDGAPALKGGRIQATFPWSAVGDLGAGWTWRVVTNVDGKDVDSCPDEGSDALRPAKYVFPEE